MLVQDLWPPKLFEFLLGMKASWAEETKTPSFNKLINNRSFRKFNFFGSFQKFVSKYATAGSLKKF